VTISYPAVQVRIPVELDISLSEMEKRLRVSIEKMIDLLMAAGGLRKAILGS
jgi:hypothetical protein